MRKIYFILAITVGVMFTSCGGLNSFLPIATNTINSVSFSELNLEREDYNILNTIETSATVTIKYNGSMVTIFDNNGLKLTYGQGKEGMVLMSAEGVLRAGFLTNDYGNVNLRSPEQIARAVAFSRLASMAKEFGGDAIIEPIVSTNVEKASRNEYVYNTIASGKVVVIKTDK